MIDCAAPEPRVVHEERVMSPHRGIWESGADYVTSQMRQLSDAIKVNLPCRLVTASGYRLVAGASRERPHALLRTCTPPRTFRPRDYHDQHKSSQGRPRH
ncbi:hypothetical protein CHELA1G11_10102 [Hyphomicrobiales bacterium]|nr:hypothetical protein CHELA1G11_10102 [Hyphomicrobiales bacterium]CAH1677054.1 hypothetical protein CHELA1G2_14207 [Hyphomicrobiales bacterium]